MEEEFINFLDKINNDNFKVEDLTVDDGEYLDTYIFEDYSKYSDSKELEERMYKMLDKYIVYFCENGDEFACFTYLPDKFHIYILKKYGKVINDVIDLYIRLADGPENMALVVELLVNNNIIINENSLKNNIDEIKEYMKDNYFDISNEKIEKYLLNYDFYNVKK